MSLRFLRFRWLAIGLPTLALSILLVGPFVHYEQRQISVCPITGTVHIHTRSFGLFDTDHTDTTPLELWLREREPSFEPEFQRISTVSYAIIGRSHGCRTAPPIYSLITVMDRLVDHLPDERISELVSVLRTGTHEEQRTFIQEITDEIFAD